MKSRKIITCLVLSISVIVTPIFVYAHGEDEFFVEQEISGFVVYMGSELDTFTERESIRLTFNLEGIAEDNDGYFTDLWVRINQDKKTIFASGIIRPEFGSTGMVFTFPESGAYELNVRYINDGENLVEAVFPITVEKNEEDTTNQSPFSLSTIVVGFIGIVVGATGIKLLKK